MGKKSAKEKKLEEQKIYKNKYRLLQRKVKQQVFINGALFDEISQMESQFLQLKNDRKYLLRRLFQHLPMTELQVLESTKALNALETSHPGQIPHSILSSVQPDEVVVISPKKNDSNKTDMPYSSNKDEGKEDYKPKRKKPGTVKKKVHPLHMDNQNVPYFPITIGTLTIFDLGEILPNKTGFHSERYLWPVGYCSTRLYPSMVDPERKVQYFCCIKDGGSDPSFEIISEDEPEKVISASTATACHCIVLKRLNKARGKATTNTGSGPEFFGFSHPTIQYLIQCLPGADKCEKYFPAPFEYAGVTPTTSSQNVIRVGNLPNMEKYDRSKLELPSVVRNIQEET